jgi:DHA1 family bicyclomycin/chloramphenicol resistance-like MFS transporter
LSQGALVALIVVGGLHILVAWSGRETMTSFVVLQALSMLCVALTGSNFGAISMEPFKMGAGLASSLQSFLAAVISSLLGAAVGASFNGTTLPLAVGFFSFGVLCLAAVAWAERGRLFTHPSAIILADAVPVVG